MQDIDLDKSNNKQNKENIIKQFESQMSLDNRVMTSQHNSQSYHSRQSDKTINKNQMQISESQQNNNVEHRNQRSNKEELNLQQDSNMQRQIKRIESLKDIDDKVSLIKSLNNNEQNGLLTEIRKVSRDMYDELCQQKNLMFDNEYEQKLRHFKFYAGKLKYNECNKLLREYFVKQPHQAYSIYIIHKNAPNISQNVDDPWKNEDQLQLCSNPQNSLMNFFQQIKQQNLSLSLDDEFDNLKTALELQDSDEIKDILIKLYNQNQQIALQITYIIKDQNREIYQYIHHYDVCQQLMKKLNHLMNSPQLQKLFQFLQEQKYNKCKQVIKLLSYQLDCREFQIIYQALITEFSQLQVDEDTIQISKFQKSAKDFIKLIQEFQSNSQCKEANKNIIEIALQQLQEKEEATAKLIISMFKDFFNKFSIKVNSSYQELVLMTKQNIRQQLNVQKDKLFEIEDYYSIDFENNYESLIKKITEQYKKKGQINSNLLVQLLFEHIKRRVSFQNIINLFQKNDIQVDFSPIQLMIFLLKRCSPNLRILITISCCQYSPFPLISQKIFESNFNVDNEQLVFNELGYIMEKRLSILNFKIGNFRNTCPKGISTFINNIYARTFNLHLENYANDGTIEIQFDYNFTKPEFFIVADSHGIMNIYTFKKVQSLFDVFILHVDVQDFSLIDQFIDILKGRNQQILTLIVINHNKQNKKLQIQEKQYYILIDTKPYFELEQSIQEAITSQILDKINKSQKIISLKDYNKDYKTRIHSMLQYLKFLKESMNENPIELELSINLVTTFFNKIGPNISDIHEKNYLPVSYYKEQLANIEKNFLKDQLLDEDQYNQLLSNQREKIFKQMQAIEESPLVNFVIDMLKQQKIIGISTIISKFLKGLIQEKLNKACCEQQRLKDEVSLQIKQLEQNGQQNNEIFKQQIEQNQQQIEQKRKDIDNLQFSIEHIFRELYLIGHETSKQNKNQYLFEKFYNDFCELSLKQGQPIEIIDGDDLQFVKDVYEKIYKDSNEELIVVSVIGQQSSGKSLLLNFLFGTQFPTSSGRCTKGVYGYLIDVLVSQNVKKKILILDTEGISSAEKKDERFDRRIVFYILCISHVVLICSKCEMTNQMAEIINLAAECIAEFKQEILKPQVYVIMNMLTEINEQANSACIDKLSNALYELKLKAQIKHKPFDLTKENVIMLPQAFNRIGNEYFIANKPSQDFADRLLPLKQKILKLAQNENRQNNQSSQLGGWFQFAKDLWENSQKLSVLQSFNTIKEKQLQEELQQRLKLIMEKILLSKNKQTEHNDQIKNIIEEIFERNKDNIIIEQKHLQDQINQEINNKIQNLYGEIERSYDEICKDLNIDRQSYIQQFRLLERQIYSKQKDWEIQSELKITNFLKEKSAGLGHIKINQLAEEILKYNDVNKKQISSQEAEIIFETKWQELKQQIKQNYGGEQNYLKDTFKDIKDYFSSEINQKFDIYDREVELKFFSKIIQCQDVTNTQFKELWGKKVNEFLYFVGQEQKPNIEKLYNFPFKKDRKFIINDQQYIKQQQINIEYHWRNLIKDNVKFEELINDVSQNCQSFMLKLMSGNNKFGQIQTQLEDSLKVFNIKPKQIFINDIQDNLKNKKNGQINTFLIQALSENSIDKYFYYFQYNKNLREFAKQNHRFDNKIQYKYLYSQKELNIEKYILKKAINYQEHPNVDNGVEVLDQKQCYEINENFQFNQFDEIKNSNLKHYFKYLLYPEDLKIQLKNDPRFSALRQYLNHNLNIDYLMRKIELSVIGKIIFDPNMDISKESVNRIIFNLSQQSNQNELNKYIRPTSSIVRSIIESINEIRNQLNDELIVFNAQLSEHDVSWMYFVGQIYLTVLIYYIKRGEIFQIINAFDIDKDSQKKFFVAKVTNNDVISDQYTAEKIVKELQNFSIDYYKQKYEQKYKSQLDFQKNEYNCQNIINKIQGESINFFEQNQKNFKLQNNLKDIDQLVKIMEKDLSDQYLKGTNSNNLFMNLNQEQVNKIQIMQYLVEPKRFLEKEFNFLWNKNNDISIKQTQQNFCSSIRKVLSSYKQFLDNLRHFLNNHKSLANSAQIFSQNNNQQNPQEQQDKNQKQNVQSNQIQEICNNAMVEYMIQLIQNQWQNQRNYEIQVGKVKCFVNYQHYQLPDFSEINSKLSKKVTRQLINSLQKQKISNIKQFIDISINLLNVMMNQDYIIPEKELYNDFKQNMQYQFKGCQEYCPLCRRQCDVLHNELEKFNERIHRCNDGHQLQGFGGNKEDSNDAILISCGDLEDYYDVYYKGKRMKWKDFKVQIANLKWEFQNQNQKMNQIDKQRQMQLWNYIGQYVCRYYQKHNININFVPATEKTYQKIHYILLLDSSSSMKGTPWNDLMRAVGDFIDTLQSSTNLQKYSAVTTITYNRDIQVIFEREIPDNQLLQQIQYQGGGTDFENPLFEAYNIIQSCGNDYDRHVICFMTDGVANHPHAAITQFQNNQQIMKKLMFTALYYGKDESYKQNIVKIANEMNGTVKQALTPEQLQKEFGCLIINLYDQ